MFLLLIFVCLFVSLVVSVGFCLFVVCCWGGRGGGGGGGGGHRVYIFTYAHCQKHDIIYII